MHNLDDITGIIVDTALKLHRDLGPGLLESVYEAIFAHALTRRGLSVRRQVGIRFTYEDLTFDDALRIDLLVENVVVVEIKSIERLGPVHLKQLLTYLRLSERPVGLLVNFGENVLKHGLHRVANRLPSDHVSRLRVGAPITPTNVNTRTS